MPVEVLAYKLCLSQVLRMQQGIKPRKRDVVPRPVVTPRQKRPVVSPKPSYPLDEMAHQLAQPLASILSFARGSQLRVRTNQLAPEDLDVALEGIAREALRAGDLLRQLREMMMEARS